MDKNRQRYKLLSNKLNNIKNFEKYDSLINERRMTKAKLMQSISDLENAIKMYNNSKKLKDIECLKIFYDNKKLMTNNEINKGRMEKYYNLKNDIENKDINNEYKRIKNENMQLNE